MIDLVEFLEARIGEDEVAAQGAWPETWQVEGNNVVTAETGLRAGFEGLRMGVAHLAMTVGKYQAEARNAAHIARHDPARVLAECAAKRAIIKEIVAIRALVADLIPGGHGRLATLYGLNAALRQFAFPYADHPDFQSEWNGPSRETGTVSETTTSSPPADLTHDVPEEQL